MERVDFELSPDVRIAHADELKRALLEVLARAESQIRLSGKRVRSIDVAGLQVLLAFVRACADRGIELTWVSASDELRAWAKLARTDGLLGL